MEFFHGVPWGMPPEELIEDVAGPDGSVFKTGTWIVRYAVFDPNE